MFHLNQQLIEAIQQDRLKEAAADRAASVARKSVNTSMAVSTGREAPAAAPVLGGRSTPAASPPAPSRLIELGWVIAADGIDGHREEVAEIAAVAMGLGAPAGIVAALTDPWTAEAPRRRAFAALVRFLLRNEEKPGAAGVAS